MFDELEKLKKMDLKSADPEEISDLIDVVRTRIHNYGKQELDTFFDIAIKIIGLKRGVAGKKAVETLSAAYSKLKTRIVSMLWSDDPHIRNTGLKIIAENKDKEILYTLIKDKDRDIRKFALDIAYEITFPEFLKLGLDDPDVNVMVSAAEYLSRLGDNSAINKIEEKLKKLSKDEIYESIFLIQSLINLEYQKTAELIRNKFDVNDPLIKPYYISACGISKDPKYIKDILDALKNDPDTRKNAIDSLVILLRDAKIPQEKKDEIKSVIESVIPNMNPSELEMIKKIQNML